MVTFFALIGASILYVLGGIAMKYSQGFQNFLPSLLVFCFFCAGAASQTWAMVKTELGLGYVFVLGLEAILAVLAGAAFFQESLTLFKIGGMVLVVAGIGLLKF
jgi:small multidrug resistance pump